MWGRRCEVRRDQVLIRRRARGLGYGCPSARDDVEEDGDNSLIDERGDSGAEEDAEPEAPDSARRRGFGVVALVHQKVVWLGPTSGERAIPAAVVRVVDDAVDTRAGHLGENRSAPKGLIYVGGRAGATRERG